MVDIPGQVSCWPGPGHAAVEASGVPDVVSAPAARYQRTGIRIRSLNHQEVGVLCIGGEDRSSSTDLTPEPPCGLSADGDQRHLGPGGACQVHSDPGHRVNRLGLRLVQNKTKRKPLVPSTVRTPVEPVELLAIFIPSDAVELVLVSVATLQDSPSSRPQISGHLNTLNHGRADSERR